ncbi:MAG: hypothetical protein NZ898_01465 [Myxococcota bacterium]|nr:hypothetical protein [Myxococcota bacterium]MDW8362504.1 hypothetical protein [Myxococcales bacterium]
MEGWVAIVENHGVELAHVAAPFEVEREEQGRFVTVEDVRLQLRRSCLQPVEPCLALAAGAALFSPPWQGRLAAEPCSTCPSCAPAPPGVYRVLVTDCSGRHRFASAPFDVAGPVDPPVGWQPR